jgi:hypothetical protein
MVNRKAPARHAGAIHHFRGADVFVRDDEALVTVINPIVLFSNGDS